MLVYRSIGESELQALLRDKVIHGRYDCVTEHQNSVNMKNACCFFVDEMMWIDAQHEFVVIVDIPVEELEFGNGEYMAANSLRKTKKWSGRNGSEFYSIREAYAHSYTIEQVKEIFLLGHYTTSCVNGKIKPICNKYDVICHHMHDVPFEGSKQEFVRDGIWYKTKEGIGDWISELKVDEGKYIEEVKQLFLSSDINMSQARQIRRILMDEGD